MIDESVIPQMCSARQHDAEAETGVPQSSVVYSAVERPREDK